MTERPVALVPIFDQFPPALTRSSAWVLWRYELVDGRWTKVPKSIHNVNASTKDPATWSSFEAVRKRYEKSPGRFDGVGIVLQNGVAGIDIDHAVDDHGAIEPWKQEVLERFRGTYRERSPSGRGFRVFVEGVAAHCGKGGPENHLEVYDKTSPRYLTVTGHRLDDTATIVEMQPSLDWVHEMYIRRDPPKARTFDSTSPTLADDEVIALARNATNGAKFLRLWAGDTSGHGDDHSSADAALVGLLRFYTQDDAQLDRLFRRSGLMRDKWDERRGDSTWGMQTINFVQHRGGDVYTPPAIPDIDISGVIDKAKARKPATEEIPQLTETTSADASRLAFDFASDLGETGDEADELVERLLTRGAMSVLYGDSNSGKTFLAIDLGFAVARKAKWMDRNIEGGLVIYLACEAPASVRKRARAYQKYHGCRVENLVIVKSPVNLFDGSGDTARILALIAEIERATGKKAELVIGDTLARLSAGANENSGEDMGVVVRHVDRIRAEAGVHFLLIHHSGKDAARGMRGWSGLRAATDTEIEVTADEATGMRAAEVTKQRDIEGKGDRIGFRLEIVQMGMGKWGQPSTSCVVLPGDAPAKAGPAKRPSEVAGAIVEFLTARGSGIKSRELVDHFDGRYIDTSVYKEVRKLIGEGKLVKVAGIVALAGPKP